jgi:hemerythrin
MRIEWACLVDTQHQELFAVASASTHWPLQANWGRQAMAQELVHLFGNHFDECSTSTRVPRRVREHERHHAEFLEKLQSILDESNARSRCAGIDRRGGQLVRRPYSGP